MKQTTSKILGTILTIFIFIWTSQSYLLWFKSFDNTIQNIQNIEEKYDWHLPVVAFIFDPRNDKSITTIQNLKTELGENRIYHISVNNKFNTKDIVDWKQDYIFQQFFQIIKKNDLRVVFRTMHEMNGGRYTRSGNPEEFQEARKHIRYISRTEWLDNHNILFDFSVNYRDLPSEWKASQDATFIECKPKLKEQLWCIGFEDYYPGDYYVDIMGFTFYNRWKWTSDRKRLSPQEIIYDPDRNTLDRIKTYNKPIFIDEVWTTAVKYNYYYNPEKSKEIYNTIRDDKNIWLKQLATFLQYEPQILGAIYFNVDLTNWLEHPQTWEADRAAINIQNWKTYFGIFDLYNQSFINNYNNQLLDLFDTETLSINNKKIFVQKNHKNIILNISNYLLQQENQDSEVILNKLTLFENLISQNTSMPKIKKNELLKIIQSTKKIFY